MELSTLIIKCDTRIIFTDNLATIQGGAVHAFYHSVILDAANLTFINNSANYTAGAMSILLSTVKFMSAVVQQLLS